MILTTRGCGVKFPQLYRPSLIRAPDFILIDETSILPPSSWTPRPAEFLIQAHHARSSKLPKRCTGCGTPAVLKKVKEVTISKVFTILNLLTFDGTKYMENGDFCSVAWSDCIYNIIVSIADAPFPPRRAFAHVKDAQMDTLHSAHALDAPMIA